MRASVAVETVGFLGLVVSVVSLSSIVVSSFLVQKYEKPVFSDDDHMKLYAKSKKVFSSQQLHALKALYAWRDKTARVADESIG